MKICTCPACLFARVQQAHREMEARLSELRDRLNGPLVVSPERGAVVLTRGDQSIEVGLHEAMPMVRAVLATVDALEDAR